MRTSIFIPLLSIASLVVTACAQKNKHADTETEDKQEATVDTCFIKGLEKFVVYCPENDPDNKGVTFNYDDGRKLKVRMYENMVFYMDVILTDENGREEMLDVDFGDVGVELIDGQYDRPYRNNEYVIGQYDFDADGADELIVGMRSRLADDMNGVSLNIWRIRDMKRWTFSTGMNILGDAICSFYMNKINIPRYHRGFYYEWTYQNGTFEFTGEI